MTTRSTGSRRATEFLAEFVEWTGRALFALVLISSVLIFVALLGLVF